MTTATVLQAAKTLAEFCREQGSCQNCIFRKHGADRWHCQLRLDKYRVDDTEALIKAKKKYRGYIP